MCIRAFVQNGIVIASCESRSLFQDAVGVLYFVSRDKIEIDLGRTRVHDHDHYKDSIHER